MRKKRKRRCDEMEEEDLIKPSADYRMGRLLRRQMKEEQATEVEQEEKRNRSISPSASPGSRGRGDMVSYHPTKPARPLFGVERGRDMGVLL